MKDLLVFNVAPLQPVPSSSEGRNFHAAAIVLAVPQTRRAIFKREGSMDGIIYLVGLIVVVMAILSFLGLR